MDQTLRQLGDLLRGSVPTVIFFLVTYLAYRLILHGPLQRVLEDRRQRTTGAMEKARVAMAAAEAKAAEYEKRLREARLAIFKAQEARHQQALEHRAAALAEARERASAMVQEARARLQDEMQAARVSLELESGRLANEVIRTILRPVAVAQTPAGGAQ